MSKLPSQSQYQKHRPHFLLCLVFARLGLHPHLLNIVFLRAVVARLCRALIAIFFVTCALVDISCRRSRSIR